MSKKRQKNHKKADVSKATDYYRLKTKAVNDLITADESNSPEVSEEELNAYRSGPKVRLADWLKMCLIKAWFPGSVCFFFFWGLGNYMADQLDMMVATGIALGVVTEMLTNNVIRFMEKTPGAHDRWMMFPSKKYATFPLNIVYSFLILALVIRLYNLINTIVIALTGAVDTLPLGVEPVLFGLFYMGFDQLLIQMKLAFLRWLDSGISGTKRNREVLK